MYLDPCLPLLKQGLWHCGQRHGWVSWSISWSLPAAVISNIAPYHSPDSERMEKMACKRERESAPLRIMVPISREESTETK